MFFLFPPKGPPISPVLAYPNFDHPFVFFTNASYVAVRFFLAWLNANKFDYPMTYQNKKLSKAEHKYGVTKHECLAVMLVQQPRHFLYGAHLKVVTDYSSL